MRVCLACGGALRPGSWACPSCAWAPADGPFPRFAPDAADGDGFPEGAFGHLPELEQRSFWFRGRNRFVLWALREHFPHARSYLEVGAGTGFVLRGVHEALPALELTAAELFDAGLEVAHARVPEATLVQADARRLPFRDEFDVAGAFDVLEHVREDEDALRELRRAIVPGGGVVVTVPQHPRLWSKADEFGRHERRYTRSELVAKLRRAGLDVLRVTSFVTLLLPAMAVSRWRERRSRAPYDPQAELRLPPRADRLLERTLELELALVRRGVSLPAGGSLLAVARRPAAA